MSRSSPHALHWIDPPEKHLPLVTTEEPFHEWPIPVASPAVQDERISQLDDFTAWTQRLTWLSAQEQAASAALKKSPLHQPFTGAL